MTKQKHSKAIDAASNAEELLPLEQMMSQGSAPNEGTAYAVDDANQDKDSEHQVTESEGTYVVSLVPKLRFSGFFDDWMFVSAGQLGNWKSGTTPLRSNKDYWDQGSVNWLKTGELADSEVFEVEEHITEKALNSTSLRLNPVGAVLVAMYGATAGKIGILAIPSTTNQACCACIVDPNVADNWFVFISFLKVRDSLLKTTDGSAQPNLNKDKITSTKLLVPCLQEQQRIGALFKELDNNIELNRGLLEKLIQLKKSMLEQMFPREGESVPRLRFAGFTEPWRKRDLGEISNKITDGTHNPPPNEPNGIPVLSAKDIDEFGNLLFSDVSRLASEQSFKIECKKSGGLELGDILVTIIGSIGRVAVVESLHKFMLQRSVAIIKPKRELILSDFLRLVFEQPLNQSWLENNAEGSTQKGLYLTKLATMPLLFPSVAEQQRIGELFKALDQRITQQRAKVEKLGQLKKALLEQMFV